MQSQARLRRWSMGGATGPKTMFISKEQGKEKKHPENETSLGPETFLSSSWSYY